MSVFIREPERRTSLGLRERKKTRTRKAIEAAALECLTRNGWDATTVSDIAETAEVGVGTLYNYFPSKGALVASVTRQEMMEALQRSEEISVGGRTPAECVLPVLGEVLRMMDRFGKPVLREVVGAALQSAGGDLGREMMKADMMVVEEIQRRLEDIRNRQRLSSDLPPAELAMLVYSAAMGLLMFYMFDDQLELPWLLAEVDTAVTALLRGAEE
ncbi:MAG: TetR/AcrR family transcriptional regulator [Candidatus Fermentibacteraceae bacterium]